MAASPGTALAGVSIAGLGALIAYGAYRNVPVFGASGLLTEAIKTGKLQAVSAQNARLQAAKQQSGTPWYDQPSGTSHG